MARITLVSGLLAGLAIVSLDAVPARAAEEGHVVDYAFSFEGPFGTFDQAQLQRGPGRHRARLWPGPRAGRKLG